MKSKKLLGKLNRLLGLGDNAEEKHVKKLRKVLKTLKEKQDSLKLKLETTEGESERRKLKQKIEVIQRQREKGVEVYKGMKERRDKPQAEPPASSDQV